MSASDDYKLRRNMIEAAIKGGAGKEELAWTVVDGVAAVIDGATGGIAGGVGSGSLQTLRAAFQQRDTIGVTPNPWFIWNGHDDGPFSYTQKYLRNRGRKGIAGGALAVGGTAASQATQVDVAGIIQHGNAIGSSSAHLVQLRSIAASYRQSRTLTGWFDLLIRMKAFKIGVRGTQLAGAAIPVGAVGIVTGVAAAAVKVGVKLTYTKVCLVTAADIHWRAFQEQAISGGLGLGRGKVGPASRIMYEIFARRGMTRVFGKYDVDRLIKEPTGWMALSDKMLLI